MNPPLRAGILAAIAVLVLDQASKLWLLFSFDLARRGVVQVTPFFDLVLAWNVGISFGWFQNDSLVAQTILTIVKAPPWSRSRSGWPGPVRGLQPSASG